MAAITRPRQYRVTHIATGQVTYVNHKEYRCAGRWSPEVYGAAARAGLRYPADCDVQIVPRYAEERLAFDEIPLVLMPKRAPDD